MSYLTQVPAASMHSKIHALRPDINCILLNSQTAPELKGKIISMCAWVRALDKQIMVQMLFSVWKYSHLQDNNC